MDAAILERIRIGKQSSECMEDEDIIEAAAEEYEELVRTDEDVELIMHKATSALRRLREAGKVPGEEKDEITEEKNDF